ncbi:MAG TPA: sensor domain-containing diguanylate cyclase [Thermoanaerobaculia bacterium]|nr:sensor domain-containing diguanylate cyclase [Thermoanaerobaculia bacterium]
MALVVLMTVAGSLFELSSMTAADLRTLAFFTLLVVVATALRVPRAHRTIGFETAAALPAIFLFHDPGFGLIPVFAGLIFFELISSIRSRSFQLETLFEAAQPALAYYLAGWLFVLTTEQNAELRAKVPGFILLCGAFFLFRLAFAAMQQAADRHDLSRDLGPFMVMQAKSLALVLPIIVAEVLIYPSAGKLGVMVAFFPVLLVANVMRHEFTVARENSELIRRNRELSLVSKSSLDLFSTEGDEAPFTRMITLLSDLVKMKACVVIAWDPGPDLPGVVHRFGDCRVSERIILKWAESSELQHVAPAQPMLTLAADRTLKLSESNLATQLIVGVQTVEVVYGLVIFETEDAEILSSETAALFKHIVNQTALSLQDQLLKREMREKTILLEKAAERMSLILSVSNGLIGNVDLQDLFRSIAKALRSTMAVSDIMFGLYDAKKDEFVRSAMGSTEESWQRKVEDRITASKIRDFMTDDYRVSSSYFIPHKEMRRRDIDLFFPSSLRPEAEQVNDDLLIVPLTTNGQLAGYIAIRKPGDGKIPPVEQFEVIEIFANQAVTALQKARQYEEIKRLTVIDGLTPAFNHRYFQEALDREVHRHQRISHTFALAMIDIDDFKSFNDRLGHQAGDEVLKGLVKALMENVREIDTVARYGGEEFTIIFPELPPEEAFPTIDRLREMIATTGFYLPIVEQTVRLTMSVGAAVYPLDATTASALVSRADAALYQAKRDGKNRVCLASDVRVEA